MSDAGHLIDFDTAPSVPTGWSILPDTEQLPRRVRGRRTFDPRQVALYWDDEHKETSWIQGNDLRKKLTHVPVYGAQLGDFYKAHPQLIPEEYKGNAIFFWGHIYRHTDGNSVVRCQSWNGREWVWFYYWLGFPWNRFNPAAIATG